MIKPGDDHTQGFSSYTYYFYYYLGNSICLFSLNYHQYQFFSITVLKFKSVHSAYGLIIQLFYRLYFLNSISQNMLQKNNLKLYAKTNHKISLIICIHLLHTTILLYVYYFLILAESILMLITRASIFRYNYFIIQSIPC